MFHRIIFSASTIFFALVSVACGSASTPTPLPTTISPATATVAPTRAPTVTPTPITATDTSGRKITLAAYPQRIISLAPSSTEILFALGLGPQVVGVDEFTDFPAEAKTIAKVGGSNGKYNLEQIVALKPDLILAAGIAGPEVIKKLEELKLTVILVGATQTTFDNIFTDIALVGQITGRGEQAKRVTDTMKQKMETIKAKVATAKTKPRVYWELDATDPSKPFSVGTPSFINDIITLAGGVNVFGNVAKSYPQVSSEQIIAAKPDVIIMSDVAYGVTVDSLLKRRGWQVIEAVKNKHVYPIEDNLVSRPGPRVVDGLEAAAKLIHPELFK